MVAYAYLLPMYPPEREIDDSASNSFFEKNDNIRTTPNATRIITRIVMKTL
jgi:hypothetical protein